MDKVILIWQNILNAFEPDIIIRMSLSFAVGAVIGLEREQHGRAAGLRTTILVCLSSCVAMIISESFYLDSLASMGAAAMPKPDPARLAAGALSGMGFLGAGVIIRQSDHVVRGVTTAATLWCATVIGLALGAGCIGIGLAATIFVVIVLYILPWLEGCIKNDWYSNISVSFDAKILSLDSILNGIKEFRIKVKDVDLRMSSRNSERVAVIRLKYKKKSMTRFPVQVSEHVAAMPGVTEVHWFA